jgi:hypothetical protein
MNGLRRSTVLCKLKFLVLKAAESKYVPSVVSLRASERAPSLVCRDMWRTGLLSLWILFLSLFCIGTCFLWAKWFRLYVNKRCVMCMFVCWGRVWAMSVVLCRCGYVLVVFVVLLRRCLDVSTLAQNKGLPHMRTHHTNIHVSLFFFPCLWSFCLPCVVVVVETQGNLWYVEIICDMIGFAYGCKTPIAPHPVVIGRHSVMKFFLCMNSVWD